MPGCARWRPRAGLTVRADCHPARCATSTPSCGQHSPTRSSTAGSPSTPRTGNPPSPSQARPPEMHAWTAPELARFLRWADEHDSDIAMAWRRLAYTGMRRGEALSLRWRDVDLDAGRVAVRRSVGVVKDKGKGEQLPEGATKTGQSRVVELDAGTVAALRAYRAVRGSVALDLVRDTALVLGPFHGRPPPPRRVSRRFVDHVRQARKAWGRSSCR